jgi:hypothetical protein
MSLLTSDTSKKQAQGTISNWINVIYAREDISPAQLSVYSALMHYLCGNGSHYSLDVNVDGCLELFFRAKGHLLLILGNNYRPSIMNPDVAHTLLNALIL